MYNIQNKTVMITGAASGIGYKYAEILLRNGAKSIAIIDLPTSNGQNAVITLENEFEKGRVIFIVCDVTNAEELKNTFKRVIDIFHGLDILINNAGMCNDQLWENTINLNVTALIRSSLLAIDYMGKHKGGKGGTIVNISSIAGLENSGTLPVYSASKYAVLGFSQALAKSYNNTGVRVIIMCPGVTFTPLIENIPQKLFDFVPKKEESVGQYSKQSAEHVALAILDLIQNGENEAVWVSEGGQPSYAVDFPHYSKRSVSI